MSGGEEVACFLVAPAPDDEEVELVLVATLELARVAVLVVHRVVAELAVRVLERGQRLVDQRVNPTRSTRASQIPYAIDWQLCGPTASAMQFFKCLYLVYCLPDALTMYQLTILRQAWTDHTFFFSGRFFSI